MVYDTGAEDMYMYVEAVLIIYKLSGSGAGEQNNKTLEYQDPGRQGMSVDDNLAFGICKYIMPYLIHNRYVQRTLCQGK